MKHLLRLLIGAVVIIPAVLIALELLLWIAAWDQYPNTLLSILLVIFMYQAGWLTEKLWSKEA